jgi:DNA-binding MarR family transcriptional regulator
VRIHLARQRPAWRRRLFGGLAAGPADGMSISVLRVLRAVESSDAGNQQASIGDVADYMAIEHSTASRLVASVVASGLLTKAVAAQDQRRSTLALTDRGRHALDDVTERRHELVGEVVADWQSDDIDVLLGLLGRLADGFERVAGR